MRTLALLLLTLTLPPSLIAQPVVLSVRPDRGPVTGGTTVTISGRGFIDRCDPQQQCASAAPQVIFGGVPAAQVRPIDDETIQAITPPHLPGLVDVRVHQSNGESTLPGAFLYEGDPSEAFDRYLLPIFTTVIHGAFGSEFHSDFRAWNAGTDRPIHLFGFETLCHTNCRPRRLLDDPLLLQPRRVDSVELLAVGFGTPGQFFYVPRGESESLAMNLRVFNAASPSIDFGTELPVVHEREFRHRPFALISVPLDLRLRNALRLYAFGNARVRITIGASVSEVELLPGRTLFEPSYALFMDFPPPAAGTSPTTYLPQEFARVLIEPLRGRVWGFITTTNNINQRITTITPQ